MSEHRKEKETGEVIRGLSAAVGVDVSARTLALCRLTADGRRESRAVPNTAAGWAQAARLLRADGADGADGAAAMEATGWYHLGLARHLFAGGARVAVLNPRAVKRYGDARQRRNKDDAGDAELIADYALWRSGQAAGLRLWRPPAAAVAALKELRGNLRQVASELRRLENRRARLESKAAQASAARRARFCRAERARLLKALRALCAKDAELGAGAALLRTIPGVGEETAWALLAAEPWKFAEAKAFAAMFGLTPMRVESGAGVRKSRLSSDGHRWLRAALHHPAMTAARHNPAVRALSERMRTLGKPGRARICACAHKLARIAHGVLRAGCPFDPSHSARITT